MQGLGWLLQGLPHDLDDHERTDLRRAMPSYLLGERSSGGGGGGGRGEGDRRLVGSALRPGDGRRSFIARVVAALIVQLVVPMQFVWAYLITLLGRALYLERKYKVAERVVKSSGELGYTVGKTGVKLSGVLYNHGGAQVGAVLTGAVAYVADGVVKGISDGIREACLEAEENDGD